ncbi:Os09g0559150, partial [Oryza sativa Japonica Group]
MCMHPRFFSIGSRHLGQCFVFASTQLAVSDFMAFFSDHAYTVSHDTGRCASSPHRKQNPCPCLHSTSSCFSSPPPPPTNSMARVHPGPGHHLILVPSSTYDRSKNVAYRALSASPATSSTSSRTTAAEHAGSGHRNDRRRVDVPAPAADAVEVGAPGRSHLAGGVLVEADGADERVGVARHGGAAERHAGGGAGSVAVAEQPVLELDEAPLVVPEEDGGEPRRDREELADVGRVRVLPRADLLLGQIPVPPVDLGEVDGGGRLLFLGLVVVVVIYLLFLQIPTLAVVVDVAVHLVGVIVAIVGIVAFVALSVVLAVA